MLNINNEEWHIDNGLLLSYRGQSEHVIIPNGVTAIHEGAFAATRVVSVNIPGTIRLIPSCVFFNHHELTEVILNEGIEVIGSQAFYNTSLTNIKFPNSLKIIYYCAFAGANITKVELPKDLTKIGEKAFFCCPLEFIIFRGYFPKKGLGSFAFWNNENLAVIVLNFSSLKNIICDFFIFKIDSFEIIVNNNFSMFKAKKFLKRYPNKKITFLNYYNERQLAELRKINPNVMMNINNPHKKETKMDPQVSPLDKEINDLVIKITEKADILDDENKTKVLNEVAVLISDYQTSLESLKPELDFSRKVNLTLAPNHQILKNNLLNRLNVILLGFTKLDNNFMLKEKLDAYENFIINDVKIESFDIISKKLEEINEIACQISSLNSRIAIDKMLIDVLNEIRIEIKASSKKEFCLELNLISSPNYEEILIKKINEALTIVTLTYDIDQSLFTNNTNLGKDINKLRTIIDFLDDKNKELYDTKLKLIIEKYLRKVDSLDINSNTELEIRSDIMPIIEDLLKIIPSVMDKKEVLTYLIEANKVLEGNDFILGPISSLVNDILVLLRNNNLEEKIKFTVITELNTIINTSYNYVLHDTFKIESNELYQNLNSNLQITLQILKNIYAIKFELEKYIEDTKEYNENISSINHRGT